MIEIKKLYHSTLKKNLDSILENGLKTGCDGVIYFADSVQNALKFPIIRGKKVEDLIVIEIDTESIEKSKLDYSYDHSEAFFKCKAYIYPEVIPAETINSSALIYEF
jgi:RNA:NAD 2'-phosphotransferase (TPT1/KptA family)